MDYEQAAQAPRKEASYLGSSPRTSIGAGASPIQRDTILTALTRQSETLVRLAQLLQGVEDRLQPVLSDAKDPMNQLNRPPSTQPTSVIHQIEFHSEAIRMVAAKLEDFLNRLEL